MMAIPFVYHCQKLLKITLLRELKGNLTETSIVDIEVGICYTTTETIESEAAAEKESSSSESSGENTDSSDTESTTESSEETQTESSDTSINRNICSRWCQR